MFGLRPFASVMIEQVPLPIGVVGTSKLADPDTEQAVGAPVAHLIKERPRGAVNDIGKLCRSVERLAFGDELVVGGFEFQRHNAARFVFGFAKKS